MGFTGMHLLLIIGVPAVLLVGVVVGIYFLVRKAVAAGVREAHRKEMPAKQGVSRS